MENSTALANRYRQTLRKLFRELDDNALNQLLETGRKQHIESGQFLFKQGELGNALYIVLLGRLRAIIQKDPESQEYTILGDIGEGEPIGEFALFTNEPRMASIVAIRRSTVLEITKEKYVELVSINPAFAETLTQFIINRMKRNVFQQRMGAAPKNIAFINLHEKLDINSWIGEIQSTLAPTQDPVMILDHSLTSEGDYRIALDALDEHDGLNLLLCKSMHAEWSRQCLSHSDLVVLVADFDSDTQLSNIEKTLDLYSRSILDKKIYLLLLHPENAPPPVNTKDWFKQRNVHLHIHVRKNNLADLRRFCRIITNQAIGLVLGGGGAKGFAHVGAMKALAEAGIEIDFLGGTSAGAVYGLGMSHADFSEKKIEELCQEAARRKLTSNDYALPLMAMMSGKKIEDFIRYMFGDSNLEDFWVNSYCVSTNYSTALAKVHDRGLAWKAVKASIAIPGIFPPVVIDRQLHVDGGVVDNLPIESMYKYPVRHIIAISLIHISSKEVTFPETPSVSALLWDKLTRKRKYRLPGLASILINSLILNSRQKQEATKSQVSMYIEMELRGVGLLDDSKWKYIIQKGQDQISGYLETLPEEEKFWLPSSQQVS